MNTMKRVYQTAILAGILTVPMFGWGAERPAEAKPLQPKAIPVQTCVVSDEKLGEMGEPYIHKHNGREIKFCCKGCLKDFNRDPAKYLKKIEQAEAKASKIKPYPLNTCVVTDEKLGEMGDPYVHKHNGQEVKFCCKGCLKDFNRDPAKYLKKVEAARQKSASKS